MKPLTLAPFLLLLLPAKGLAQNAEIGSPFIGCPSPSTEEAIDAIVKAIEAVAAAAPKPTLGCEEATPQGAKTLARATAPHHREVLDVPADIQDAQDCGFHALRMLMRYLAEKQGAPVPVPYVDKGEGYDPMRESMNDRPDPADRPLRNGGASVHVLANVATHFSFAATGWTDDPQRTRKKDGIAELKRLTQSGTPVEVRFMCNESGCPVRLSAAKAAHFAVIEGVITGEDGHEYVVARHPWRTEEFLWRADDFESSWGDANHDMLTIQPTSNSRGAALVQQMLDSKYHH